jgi:DNA-binding response OmpR family regulator
MQDIPEKIYQKILKNTLTLVEKNLLERLGVIIGGRLFQPLLNFLPTEKEAKNMPLSLTEEKIYTVLLDNKNKIVTRQQLAKIVWGEKGERKYSQWAISEIMYRIRKKLPFGTTLQTLRNRGYMLHVV